MRFWEASVEIFIDGCASIVPWRRLLTAQSREQAPVLVRDGVVAAPEKLQVPTAIDASCLDAGKNDGIF